MRQMYTERLAAWTIPLVLFTILFLHFLFPGFFRLDVTFEPSLLLPFLDPALVGLTPLAVSYFAARSYLRSGAVSYLFLGCGVLVFGLAGLAAGWFHSLPQRAEPTAIFTVCALAAGVFHFFAAATALPRAPAGGAGNRKRNLAFGYAGVTLLGAFVVAGTVEEIIPPILVQGIGSTPLRQGILGLAVILFFFSALILHQFSKGDKSNFAYWYCLGLLLMGPGLLAFGLSPAVGGLAGWAGRLSLYLGGIYFLVAVLSLRAEDEPIEEVLGRLFKKPEELSIFESSMDGILLVAESGKILAANPRACEMLGYSEEEITGAERSAIFDLSDPNLDLLLEDQARTGRCRGESRFIRKDGTGFPVEMSSALFRGDQENICSLIIRDITERKEPVNTFFGDPRAEDGPRLSVPVDLARIIREAANSLETFTGNDGATIEIGVLPKIEGDPALLGLLFQHLLGNAMKHRREEEEPFVRIDGYTSGNLCHLFVRDNGKGFEAKHMDRLFQTLEGTQKEFSDRVGTGLAVCRKVAERHGGGIRAQSIPGKGSTFIITLPAKPQRTGEGEDSPNLRRFDGGKHEGNLPGLE